MAHQNDQVVSMPKAFIFYKGEAHLRDYPVNDNRSAGTGKNRWPLIAALIITGVAAYFFFS